MTFDDSIISHERSGLTTKAVGSEELFEAADAIGELLRIKLSKVTGCGV